MRDWTRPLTPRTVWLDCVLPIDPRSRGVTGLSAVVCGGFGPGLVHSSRWARTAAWSEAGWVRRAAASAVMLGSCSNPAWRMTSTVGGEVSRGWLTTMWSISSPWPSKRRVNRCSAGMRLARFHSGSRSPWSGRVKPGCRDGSRVAALPWYRPGYLSPVRMTGGCQSHLRSAACMLFTSAQLRASQPDAAAGPGRPAGRSRRGRRHWPGPGARGRAARPRRPVGRWRPTAGIRFRSRQSLVRSASRSAPRSA
jgi:hypothetical protein